VTNLLGDLKHGVRLIREAPGFAAAAVLTLALAIGANTVIFSFVNLLVLQPLPLASPERLGWIMFTNPQNAMDRWPASLPEFAAFNDGVGAFESLAGRQERTFTLSEQGTVAERVSASVVVGDLFAVWGVQILQGRGLTAIDERPGSPAVVVLSHRYWVRRFGSAPVIGQSLSLDGRLSTIVGIVSPRIELGDLAEIDIWLPFQGTPALESRVDRSWQLTGRLLPDATLALAHTQSAAVAERLEREHPDTNRNWRARVAPTREANAGPNTWVALAVLLTIVGLLLLLACANVTNMLLARLTARRQELAVRVALGATRFRIARQLITEALLLGVAGAAVGLLIGGAGMRLMRAASAEPIFEQVVIDTNVLLFAIGLGLLTPILYDPGDQHASGSARLPPTGDEKYRPGRAAARRAVGADHGRVAAGGASFALQTMMAIHVEPGFTPGGLPTWQPDAVEVSGPRASAIRERLFDALSRDPRVGASRRS
jgi:putative ABC transport system permease protein